MKKTITLLLILISAMFILNCSKNPTGPDLQGDNTVFDNPNAETTYYFLYLYGGVWLEDPENPGTFFWATNSEFPVFEKFFLTENGPGDPDPGEMTWIDTETGLPFTYEYETMASSPNWGTWIMYQNDISRGSVHGYPNYTWEYDTMSHWDYYCDDYYYKPLEPWIEVKLETQYFLLAR